MVSKLKMKYAIFYLIKGEAQKYRDKLVAEVGPKFGERYVLESKLPAHLTLKTPFEIKDIKKIEKIIKEFVKTQKLSKIKIIGFGNFRKFVTFLDFKFSQETLIAQKKLIQELELGLKNGSVELQGKEEGKAVLISSNSENNYLNWIKEDLMDSFLQSIQEAKGIDCWILGVGENGHLAFHESGIPLEHKI